MFLSFLDRCLRVYFTKRKVGAKLWEILPEKLKNIENLEHLKKETKT